MVEWPLGGVFGGLVVVVTVVVWRMSSVAAWCGCSKVGCLSSKSLRAKVYHGRTPIL